MSTLYYLTAENEFIKFVAYAPGDGRTLIRDPAGTPLWHDLSSLDGHPAGVTSVSLAAADFGAGLDVHITVAGEGRIGQAVCRVSPTPGTGDTPPWPANCSAFVDLTPPN